MTRLPWHGGMVVAVLALALGAALGAAGALRAAAENNAPLEAETPATLIRTAAAVPATPQAQIPEGMREKLAGLQLQLWPEAEMRGVSRALFDEAFRGLEPDASIFDLLANQPEHKSTPWDYINRLASDKRIESGRAKLTEHADVLARVEKAYGVARHVVLAVWGVESSFGVGLGTRNVVRSLATLAVGDARRPAFWRAELLAALVILQRGDIKLTRMTGSWAGAMGHTQFMPTTYLAYAVDFDGDGRRDIWQSIPDALASTANYLKASGWQAGELWGYEVVLPAGFDYGLTRPGVAKPLAAWLEMGIAAPFGKVLTASSTGFSILMPAGARGPVFLVSQNFRAILKYNNSTSYALAVGHLADRLSGAGAFAGVWPADDPPLGRSGRVLLQQGLARQGFDPGATDGMLGASTRSAIRALQRSLGLTEDGYAGEELLTRMNAAGPQR